MLLTSSQSLTAAYDLAMLDLDGVVYIGSEAVPGAAAAIAVARQAGMRVAFITNNASRSPRVVADHLVELGVEADAGDVVTSAQAASRLAREQWGEGARVVGLGAEGLRSSLVEAGLEPVGAYDDAVGVVTGYGPDVAWKEVMRVAVRVRDGLPWIASNTDQTIPTAFGTAPGHGVLVDMLSRFTGVTPVVAGKPARPLLDETVRRVGGERPLMVGDRLDTDIEGARNAGLDSLLVLTGVTGLAELVAAPPALRPSYLAGDLAGLDRAHPAPEPDGRDWGLGGWRARVVDGRLEVEALDGGSAEQDPDDAWRVAAAAAWQHLDDTGAVVDITAAGLPAPTSAAR
ncbi:HAD superfamily hydrolase (TIGR01450 family) [Nocardioides sp. J9]|uniref:HAD-IIA family hydrolase n=1 Tax=unclassified Nocardioides TaxID=2615069 RepID=UPI0004B2E4F6|nr:MULTISPECIES: HAD-IIA family hydrolase [unclassified Nocardioides]TWG97854.1 HAD superfamily hydrolase (TIGR01450 family) [Nocardioides sp. J9]